MTTYTKRILSGSTNGKGIPITATSTPGTTVHTAVSGSSDLDEIWLYAVNDTAAAIIITIEFGDVTTGEDTITVSIPSKAGLQLIVPGLLLNNGSVVGVFGASAGVTIQGFVNRITA